MERIRLQAEAKSIVRQMRQADEEIVRQNDEEEEKVRRVRAKIAAENARADAGAAAGGAASAGGAAPKKTKTLKELEEANAQAFS